MKILDIPTTKNYPGRLNAHRWTLISAGMQIILLFLLVLNDWVWSLDKSDTGMSIENLNRFLLYIPVLIISQLFMHRYRQTFIFGLIFYTAWTAFQLFELIYHSPVSINLIIFLLSLIITISISIVIYKNKQLINKQESKI